MLQTQVNPMAKQPAPDENRVLSDEQLNALVAHADAAVAREEQKMRAAEETDAEEKQAYAQAELYWNAAQAAWGAAREKFRTGDKLNSAASNLVSARRARSVLAAEQNRREQQRRR
jgi:hypothetical protein